MQIERFYTTTFTVKRQVWTSGKSVLETQGTFLGHIQQSVIGSDDNLQEYLGQAFSKAFTVWCPPDTDVKAGDRLIEGVNSYDVRFTKDRNIGGNGHLEIIIEKSDE